MPGNRPWDKELIFCWHIQLINQKNLAGHEVFPAGRKGSGAMNSDGIFLPVVDCYRNIRYLKGSSYG
jgi:hypothetical protein